MYSCQGHDGQMIFIIPSKEQYKPLLDILNAQGAQTTLEQRRLFAAEAFGVSSHYDTAIHGWFTHSSK